MKNTIFAPIHCPRGEIGRHASLRGWCLQWCAGSNPVVGTKKSDLFFKLKAENFSKRIEEKVKNNEDNLEKIDEMRHRKQQRKELFTKILRPRFMRSNCDI